METGILFEDRDLLVLNKPAGVVVNDASSVIKVKTLQSWFWERLQSGQDPDFLNYDQELVPENFDVTFGSPEAIFKERRGMVHRLDKETSGVLLFAKNPGSLVNLLSQFKNRQTTKKYLTLVHGRFGVTKDLISFPIARSKNDRMKFGVEIEGREAITNYEVKEYFAQLSLDELQKQGLSDLHLKFLKKNLSSYQGFSLVDCWPKTGRTHQIRVHLAHIKHPLVGDKLYVGKKRKKLDSLWCHRHFLHASELTFIHPRTNLPLKIAAPLTDDLKNILLLMRQ